MWSVSQRIRWLDLHVETVPRELRAIHEAIDNSPSRSPIVVPFCDGAGYAIWPMPKNAAFGIVLPPKCFERAPKYLDRAAFP